MRATTTESCISTSLLTWGHKGAIAQIDFSRRKNRSTSRNFHTEFFGEQFSKTDGVWLIGSMIFCEYKQVILSRNDQIACSTLLFR